MVDHQLKLFLVGKNSTKSSETVETVRTALDLALNDNYELEVIDILDSPEQAFQEHVLVTPTLLRSSATPTRRIVGAMNDPDKIKMALELILRNE